MHLALQVAAVYTHALTNIHHSYDIVHLTFRNISLRITYVIGCICKKRENNIDKNVPVIPSRSPCPVIKTSFQFYEPLFLYLEGGNI